MDASSTSWFPPRSTDDCSSTLRPDARSIGATTVGSSFDSRPPADHKAGVLGRLGQNAKPTQSLTALSTPHDRILEKMYNHPGKSDSALPTSTAMESHRPPLGRGYSQTGDSYHRPVVEVITRQGTKSHSLNEPANIQEGAISPTPTASFTSNTLPAARLYDPFDGSPLGIVTLAEPAVLSRETMAVSGEIGSGDDVWTHLSRVLDLQHQIARMHVDMEGLGPGTDNKGKGPLGGGFARQRTTSTSSMPGGDIEDEEGIGVADEEAEKLKAREREFKKLATQFEGRKQAINNMMSKVSALSPFVFTNVRDPKFLPQLDDLSEALSEFHSLQVPRIEFPSSSRNNTLSPTLSASDQMQSPVIIPPSDSASAVSHNQINLRSPVMRSSLPPTSSQVLGEGVTLPSGVTTNIPFPPTPVNRKAHVPTLLINSIEPSSQNYMVDSPVSTVSLKLPQENS